MELSRTRQGFLTVDGLRKLFNGAPELTCTEALVGPKQGGKLSQAYNIQQDPVGAELRRVAKTILSAF